MKALSIFWALILFGCNNKNKPMVTAESTSKIGGKDNIKSEVDSSLNLYIEKIFNLKGFEVKDGYAYVLDTSYKSKIIHVKVGLNNVDRFVIRYNFYIDKENSEIKYYNTINDSLILINDNLDLNKL